MESKRHWTFDELARQLTRRQAETDPHESLPADTYLLCNPHQVRELDRAIEKHFWPAITRTVRKAGLEVMHGAEIESEWKRWTTRAKTFVVYDPDRPPLPGELSVWWYYRGTIACSTYGYMFVSDFILTVPVTFNVLKLVELISDSVLAGNPPELSAPGGEYYSVAFNHGEGLDGPGVMQYAAGDVAERVRMNMEIIKAVDELQEHVTDAARFDALKEKLFAAYEAQ